MINQTRCFRPGELGYAINFNEARAFITPLADSHSDVKINGIKIEYTDERERDPIEEKLRITKVQSVETAVLHNGVFSVNHHSFQYGTGLRSSSDETFYLPIMLPIIINLLREKRKKSRGLEDLIPNLEKLLARIREKELIDRQK